MAAEDAGKRKVFGKPFEKGQSGNPRGRVPLPAELRDANKHTGIAFMESCNRLLQMPVSRWQEIVKDQNSLGIDALVASILLHGISKGDPRRIDYVVNRAILPITKEFRADGPDAPAQERYIIVVPSNGRDQITDVQPIDVSPKKDQDGG